MQFGLFDHLDARPESLSKTFDDRIEFIQTAEAAGFRSYHLAEHHFTPLGMAPSPSVFLAALARETKTIRLGPLVYLLPLYDPLRLTAEICMLDHLSDGRLEVGVGRGISPVELGYFHVKAEESADMYAEALEVIVQGLSSDRVSYDGKYYQYDNVPMALKPKQDPIPFWSASMSPEGQALAAKMGMHSCSLGPNAVIQGAVNNFKSVWQASAGEIRPAPAVDPLIGMYRQLVVADTDAAADKLAEHAYSTWVDKLLKLWREHNVHAPFLGDMVDLDIALKNEVIIVGSAEKVADELARHQELTGTNYGVLQIAFGDMSHAEEMHSLDLFVNKVMPKLI
jgi:alkanesulfonate monooxygenase SsuD/methylene tetrahydromethanopterin reductase-like flavin-dependent oxidoreductase (luciferase family)